MFSSQFSNYANHINEQNVLYLIFAKLPNTNPVVIKKLWISPFYPRFFQPKDKTRKVKFMSYWSAKQVLELNLLPRDDKINEN